MCKYSGPVRLDRATHAGLDASYEALSCSARDVTPLGYLNRDQSHKTAYAGQLLVSTAKEAAPEHEVAPVPRRTFTKLTSQGGRVRKCWDSGEWALSQQQLSLPVDDLASLSATSDGAPSAAVAGMESLPRRYWTAPVEEPAKRTGRSRFAPAE